MATGVTEIIRLFAGHFHLSDEVARMRQSYDEFMAQREREDFHPGSHHATHKSPDLDEFDTASRYLDPQSMAPGLIGYGPASAEPSIQKHAHRTSMRLSTKEFPTTFRRRRALLSCSSHPISCNS